MRLPPGNLLVLPTRRTNKEKKKGGKKKKKKKKNTTRWTGSGGDFSHGQADPPSRSTVAHTKGGKRKGERGKKKEKRALPCPLPQLPTTFHVRHSAANAEKRGQGEKRGKPHGPLAEGHAFALWASDLAEGLLSNLIQISSGEGGEREKKKKKRSLTRGLFFFRIFGGLFQGRKKGGEKRRKKKSCKWPLWVNRVGNRCRFCLAGRVFAGKVGRKRGEKGERGGKKKGYVPAPLPLSSRSRHAPNWSPSPRRRKGGRGKGEKKKSDSCPRDQHDFAGSSLI